MISISTLPVILGWMPSEKRAATTATNRRRVLDVAQRLLARDGAAALSLREVAREMGQSSSALYRYFANRDELLTALILDAYNDLGAAVETAEALVPRLKYRSRFRSAARAIRQWSVTHPHEYALIFGSPVPGYAAPEVTVVAATRTTVVLARIVADASAHSPARVRPTPTYRQMLEWDAVAAAMPGVAPDVARRAIVAWTLLFGAVSFELFGHYVGSVRDSARMFDATVDTAAELVGLTSG
jgi:AcrR family transcriptional regulator